MQMKRICSMILVLALFWQMLPVQALAEAGLDLPSASELAAARTLTGLAEDAPGYHAGMSVSAAMNAMQLSGWLDELLQNEMASLQGAYQSIQTTLERMKTEDPNYYGIMTDTPNNIQYPPRIETLHHQSEELREELAFYSHRLVEQSYVIDSMMERINSDEYSDTEKARAARKLESAVETIRDIRNTVVQRAAGWETQIDKWLGVLRGEYLGDDQSAVVDADWVFLVMAWNPVVAQTQASTVSLYPKGNSLLERLSPVRSALAETKQDVTLSVVNQKNFVISLKDGDKPIEGATVTAWQGEREKSGTAIGNGTYSFNVSDFWVDEDDSIELTALRMEAAGYRTIQFGRTSVKKGQVLNRPLRKDDGTPYIAGATLDDNDIYHSQYEIYYSSFNDWTRSISVTVAGVTDTLYCALRYCDATSGEWVFTEPQKIGAGVQTVTFRKMWNQLLKPGEELTILLGASEKEIKDGSPIRYPSMLTVQHGPVQRPLVDKTLALTSAFNPMGSGALSLTLPSGGKMPKFISGSMLTLDLPFSKYLPRLEINLDGSLSFSVGTQVTSLNPNDTVDANGQKVERWKTQDKRDLDKNVKNATEEQSKNKLLANAGALWNGCKSQKVLLLGQTNASVSVFMYLYGNYQQDQEGYGSIKAKGGFGVNLTFSAELTEVVFGFIFVNLGLSAALATTFQTGMTLDTYWPQGGSLSLHNPRLEGGITGITILLRLQVEVSVGVGIRGLVSVSLHGYGYISVLLELMQGGPYVTVSGRLGFYVLLQVFWVKWKVTLYDLGETVIYTNKKTASNSMLRILEPFLPSAVAESSDAQAGTSLTPASYPKLDVGSKAKAEISDAPMANDNVQILTLNGETFAFYLEKRSDRARVKWVSLNHPEKTGDFSDILISQGKSELMDYDFTVGKTDYQNIVPKAPTYDDMGILCVLATTSMGSVSIELENGEKMESQEPYNTVTYYIGFTSKKDSDGGMQTEFFSCGYTWWSTTYMKPRITFSSYMGENQSNSEKTAYYYVDITTLPIEHIFQGKEFVGCSHMQSRQEVSYKDGNVSVTEKKAEGQPNMYISPEGKKCYQVQSGAPEIYRRETNSSGDISEFASEFLSTYLLQCDRESPEEGEIELLHQVPFDGLFTLDKGQIRYFKVLGGEVQDGRQTDVIFYLVEEEVQGTTQCRLNGIQVEHVQNKKKLILDRTTYTDFDVIVPESSFDVVTIGNTTYLYWLEAVEPQSAADDRRYRIVGVIYDPAGNRMSDDFVLAEFVPEHSDDEPQKIMLTGDGKGYYLVNRGEGDSATTTLYSFPFQYVPSVDLKTVVLSDTLVRAGSYNDLVFTVANDGNAAISGFDLQIQLLENGSTTTVQTIHADIVSPNLSYSQTQQGTVSGEQSIYRMEDAAESLVQSEWHIQRKYRKYTPILHTYVETEDAQSAENGQLLPGMAAAFKTSLWIPSDWEGKKQLRLQLSRWSASTSGSGNARAIANGPEEEIVYELQSDGTMVRVQEQTNALMRTNAQPESSLYVSTQAAAQGVSLSTIHDIELDYRIYRDADDVPWVSLVITDEAATAEPIRLYALVYPEDGEESMSVALPYFDQAVSIGGTHTIDLPVSALLGGQSCHKARVAVYGIGVVERDEADNEILLVFNQSIPALTFALQPQDRIALEGETITLSVEPVGGVKPYAYQWQVAGRDGKWTDVEGGTADTLNVGPVTKEMQGWRYRCQVTDHYLTKACSDEAKLTITEAVPTGDNSHMELYLAAAVCALLALLLLRRRKRRPE